MKCFSCGYEKKDNQICKSEFIEVSTEKLFESFLLGNTGYCVESIYACPKCGTLKINIDKNS